jgi:FkbM family methyltransferase
MLGSLLTNPALRGLARRFVPPAARRRIWEAIDRLPGSRYERCAGYRVRVNDRANYHVLYKDIFRKRVYHFEAERPDPYILDCGSNIGMSILYFKRAYPRARILGFEPDPVVYPYLEENVSGNHLSDVTVKRAAVAGREGMLTFYSDGKYEACLADHLPSGGVPAGWQKMEVPCVLLRDFLGEPVDLLKMNIEGAEHEVLTACADRLRMIREMIVEYHHLPGLPRTLHQILGLLHEQGFEYLVNDFDPLTNPAAQPPFRLDAQTRYYLLVYARRRG